MTKFQLSKKNLTLLLSIIIIISSYLFAGNPDSPLVSNPQLENIDQASTSPANLTPLDQSEATSSLPTITGPSADDLYLVSKVIDGDTIEVERAGVKDKVRLIGINTPETVDPRRKVECFGREASNYAKQILSNQEVHLVFDESQEQRDKYGRLLAYIYLSDNSLFNLHMISAGYAYEYTYKIPYLHQAEFKASEAQAKSKQLGLWSLTTCSGKK